MVEEDAPVMIRSKWKSAWLSRLVASEELVGDHDFSPGSWLSADLMLELTMRSGRLAAHVDSRCRKTVNGARTRLNNIFDTDSEEFMSSKILNERF